MTALHSFEQFLNTFIPNVSSKNRQLNKATWILETTGSADAADLQAELDAECRLLYSDPQIYQQLLAWDKDPAIRDPLLKRQLNILIRSFKRNMIPPALLMEISKQEAALQCSYANFRASIDGAAVSDNELREMLKKEDNPSKRKKAWEASKQIGRLAAPQILSLVNLRNQTAQKAGYTDYFQMMLSLQEVDQTWLFNTLDDLSHRSEKAYIEALNTIEKAQCARFGVTGADLGPWAWSDPFCQEDPLDSCALDSLVVNVDMSDVGIRFYQRIGIDIKPILARSDMFERQGKSQHAFCLNVDRGADVRTLNNVRPSIKWMETVLHEFGHAIYEVGFDPTLPWLLREPPHMITTEAMALMAGRQAYLPDLLVNFLGSTNDTLIQKATDSLKRRQLIFSRWVLVMTHFEKALYQNPHQNLNQLWWDLVEEHQRIRPPKGREKESDWAAKYHLALAPVYYYSYLLGEMFASALEETLLKESKESSLASPEAGSFLQDRLFFPGNRMSWADLIKDVTGQPLSGDAWLRQFAKH